jgi:hypothetical protein
MADDYLTAHPTPRPVTRKGWILAIVVLLVFSFAYFLVVRAYQVEGDLRTTDDQQSEDVAVSVMAEPIDFDARTNALSIRFNFDVVDPDLLDAGVRLNQGIRVTINGDDGTHEFRFPKGEPIGNAEVTVGTSGEVYAYPFDQHESFFAIAVETFERGAGGINETTGQLSSAVKVRGAISGWDISAQLSDLGDFPVVTLDMKRAFSTKAFAFVLVMMAVAVVVLAFITSLMTVTNRRKFEVAFLTWNGAILFALPLLRTYLPGSPPIGAAMDIYLYLWTFVIAVGSLVLMVIAWSEQRKADLLHHSRHGAGYGS